MSVFARALVLSAAICAGSWVGLGQPDGQAALAASRRAMGSFAHEARATALTDGTSRASPGRGQDQLVPPLEKEPRTVDPSSLPDPAPPFPRLNPDARAERAWLVAEGPLHPASDGRRLVTFTFDDGPSPDTTPALLKVLEAHHIRATFFLIGGYLEGSGRRAQQARDCAKRIAQAGHYIGNHTFDHKLLTTLPEPAALAEIDDSEVAIERATGERPALFRPPYGQVDPALEKGLAARQLEMLLWSIDVDDMRKRDSDQILRALESQLSYQQGGIVLLHDVHSPSVRAFHKLVHWLNGSKWDRTHPEKPGWDIVDLKEYLTATAASPQPFASREDLQKARQAAWERVAEQAKAQQKAAPEPIGASVVTALPVEN
jgi:peptidoglycan/xylan/chitin deacetylase (PgdA/CDA1 family)